MAPRDEFTHFIPLSQMEIKSCPFTPVTVSRLLGAVGSASDIYIFFFFYINLFIYLFLAVLGLHFCARAFSSCGKWGSLLIAVCRPLLLQSTGPRRTDSAVVAHGPSRSPACGILPDQGSNPCPLHWQADSQPLRHQGSPASDIF